MARRTKQIEQLIQDVNCYLRNNKIKDEGDPAFCVTQWSLIDQGIYQGFNYFKDEYNEAGTKKRIVLAGSSTDFEYLQLY